MLQAQILILQLCYLTDLVHFQASVLRLSMVKCLSADPGLPDYLRHRNAHLSLLQHSNHLLLTEPLLLHPNIPEICPKTNICLGSEISGSISNVCTQYNIHLIDW